MPSLLERIAAAKRRKNRSAPQNAVLSHAAQGFQTQGFQNHIPARGRKPHSRNPCKQQMLFQNHIPARGRKQSASAPNAIRKEKNFKTTSPQGDGNFYFISSDTTTARAIFQNHIPARGRKLCKSQGMIRRLLISKPHPRKGTETRSPSLPRTPRGRGTAQRW